MQIQILNDNKSGQVQFVETKHSSHLKMKSSIKYVLSI